MSHTEMRFDPDLARAVALRLESLRQPGEAFTEAMVQEAIKLGSADFRSEKEKAQEVQAAAEAEARAVDEALLNRRYLLALCHRERGQFECLDNRTLRDIANLTVAPYSSFDDWTSRG